MYTGFFRRLHEMVHYCLSDMRTTTTRDITRILEVNTINPAAVKWAWQPRTCLPDDEWKVEEMADMLAVWLGLKPVYYSTVNLIPT